MDHIGQHVRNIVKEASGGSVVLFPARITPNGPDADIIILRDEMDRISDEKGGIVPMAQTVLTAMQIAILQRKQVLSAAEKAVIAEMARQVVCVL